MENSYYDAYCCLVNELGLTSEEANDLLREINKNKKNDLHSQILNKDNLNISNNQSHD